MSNTMQIVVVILLLSLHLFGFHTIVKLNELQESIENCQYLQLQDECDRCKAQESMNWQNAAIKRNDMLDECQSDLDDCLGVKETLSNWCRRHLGLEAPSD